MANIKKVIERIEGRGGKIYWIFALERLGDINKNQAGYLINYFNL